MKNILNYAKAEYRHWQSTSSFLICPKHIEEQSVWRTSLIQEKSPLCLDRGNCRLCGCETIDKTFEQDACKGGCYPKQMDEKTWNNFKKQNNIEILC